MVNHISRRLLVAGALVPWRRLRAAMPEWASAPIGWPGEVPGAGFLIRHGFACENPWFAAGWWHTGEDWYAIDGDTAGANVFAVAAGEVVYADYSYPGRVVIVRHDVELFTMYGHLNPDSVPQVGATVIAGERIGTVLQQAAQRGPGMAPSHLHFEVRTFFTEDLVNGDSPQHGVNCGFQCPPGPGYWPQSAAEHPVHLGWRNPTLFALGRLGEGLPEAVPVEANTLPGALMLHAEPDAASEVLAELELSGALLQAVVADPADSLMTSAEAYRAWFEVELAGGERGWVQAVVPSSVETGSDGRPSAVDRLLLVKP